MADLLGIIAEERRKEILRMVWVEERSAGEIAGALPVSFGAVSQHLKVLLEAGLVEVRRDGKYRFYRANKNAMGALGEALEEMWFGKLGELKRLAEESQKRKGSTSVVGRTVRHRAEKKNLKVRFDLKKPGSDKRGTRSRATRSRKGGGQ